MAHQIAGIDHIAITVRNLEQATRFYCDVLGGAIAHEHQFGGEIAVRQVMIGKAMVNLHQAPLDPVLPRKRAFLVAERPTPGAVDLCFRWSEEIKSAISFLCDAGIEIIDGPVERLASSGDVGTSIYFRDPDGNLLEFLSTLGAGSDL